MSKKNMPKTKSSRKYITEICELLSATGLFVNTTVLIVFRNIWTYEEPRDFRATPKSSYLTIMQYNPIFAIIYILCGGILLLCGINKLVNYVNIKRKRKSLYIKSKKHFIILVVLMAAVGFIILNGVLINKFGDNFLIYEFFIMESLGGAAMVILGIDCLVSLVKKAIGIKDKEEP